MPFIAPVIAGIAGAVGTLGAGAGLLGIVGKTALALGLSVGVQALMGAFSDESAQASGVQADVSFGGDVPRTVLYGRCGSAGHFVYKNEYDKHNKMLQLVYVLSDSRCKRLEKIWIDGEEKALLSRSIPAGNTETARYAVDGYKDNGEDKFIVRFFEGRLNQPADAELVDHASGSAGNKSWTSSSRLGGCCYVSLTLWYETELFPTGLPALFFEVAGSVLYDFRKDSTAGGNGPQRWGDKSTWQFSENPVIQEYNFRRGYWRGTEKVLGMGVPVWDLLLDYYAAGANICDEQMTKPNGDTVARYRCSAIVSDDMEYGSASEAFMRACAGYVLERGGSFGVFAGAGQPIVAEITDDDLVVGEPVSFSRYLPRTELINSVDGVYTEPGQMWEEIAYKSLRNDVWEAQDGGERLEARHDVPTVTDYWQAMRVRSIRVKEVRQQRRGQISVDLRFLYLEAGDWIRWNSGHTGSHVYRIQERMRDGNVIRLTLRETDSSVYGGVADDNEVIETILNAVPPSRSMTVVGLQLQATTLRGDRGQEWPVLKVTWDAPEDRRVKAVVLEYRMLNSPAVHRVADRRPEDGVYYIRDIVAGTDYQVRATIETIPARPTIWTPWLTLQTAMAYELVDVQADLAAAAAIADGLQADIISATDDIATSAAALSDLRQALDQRPNVRDRVASRVKFGWFDDIEQVGLSTLILLEKLAEIDRTLRTAGIEIDPATGKVRLEAVEGLDARLSLMLDAQAGLIEARATRVELSEAVAAVVSGFESAEHWTFDSTAGGWSASAGAVSWAAGALSAGANTTAQSPVISVDGDINSLVQLHIRRASGTGWNVSLQWDAGDGWTGGLAVNPPANPDGGGLVPINAGLDAGWTGTIVRVRLVVTGPETFEIDDFKIGQSALQQLFLDDIEGTITDLTTRIDLNTASIEDRATRVDLGLETDRITDVVSRLSAAEGAILLRASTATVDAISTTLSAAMQQVDALNGAVKSMVVAGSFGGLQRQIDLIGLAVLEDILNGRRRADDLAAGLAVASRTLSARVEDGETARAEEQLVLSAAVGDAVAAVEEERVARSSALEAVATVTTALTARVDSVETGAAETTAAVTVALAELMSARAVWADETSAFASDILALQVRTTDAEASITAESVARSDGLSAEAAARQVLSTTVGGNTATLQQHAGSIDGISAQWGMTLSINNTTGSVTYTGMRQLGGGVLYQLRVTGDVFVDGSITGRKLAADSVTANKMKVSSLAAITASLGTVVSGRLLSTNGKLDINMVTPRLLMSD